MNTLPNNASLIKNPLGLNVPSHLWVDIYFAPKDGSRLIGRDVLGNIDMIKWWGSCWWTKNFGKEIVNGQIINLFNCYLNTFI